MSVADQVVIFFAVTAGLLDDVPVDKVNEFESGLIKYAHNRGQEMLKTISKTGDLNEKDETKLKKIINDYKDTLDYLIKEEGKK